MEKNFWNDAAKYGLIIGIILSVSTVLETGMLLSGDLGLYFVMALEMIFVVVLHYYLLHRYTRNRSRLYTADEGFTFGQGYSYVLALSAFAGIIVGAVQCVYLHGILGYSAYTARMADVISGFMSMAGNMPAGYSDLMGQYVEQFRNAPVPSVFTTAWAAFGQSLLFGAVFGLIIAGVLSRAPKPFASNHNDNE